MMQHNGHFPVPLPDVPGWPEIQQLAFEKEALGLYMSGHPLERFAESMRAFGLREIEVGEHDILYGAALSAAR